MAITRHEFDATILREYDVRGVIGQTLSAKDAEALGRAFAVCVREKGGSHVAVGYDGRLSSPEMADALVKGMTDSGLKVARIGCGPTPMLYFTVNVHNLDGGIMVTGSHNPPDYNGFKMLLGRKPFFGEQIRRLGEIAAEGSFVDGEGESYELDVSEDYLTKLHEAYREPEGLKVAWDCGNGSTGAIVTELVKRLPGDHVLLYEDIDGNFPNHHPDPTVPENLVQLQETVRREGCDIGIAFDGDGDRCGVVDETGHILWADQFLILLAQDVLAERPGSTIIADVKASQVLFDAIAAAGGKPLMYRTGHSLIKSKMAEVNAPLAGEMSGHIFFADRYFGYDDAIYVAVRLLDVLARRDQPLSAFREGLPPAYNTPEIRFPCAEDRKFPVIEEVRQRLADMGAEVNAIDGVRVLTEDGWWLLRASNTQDVLVARCEASSPEGLDRLKAILAEQVRASGLTVPAF